MPIAGRAKDGAPRHVASFGDGDAARVHAALVPPCRRNTPELDESRGFMKLDCWRNHAQITSWTPRSRHWTNVLVIACLLAMPVDGYAHTRLKSSSPSAGAHLNVVPRQIRLDFSEVPELNFTTVQLIDPSGRPVRLSAPAYAADSKRSVVITILGGMPAGDYTVVWQTASDDGHPVRDRFKFVVAPGSAGVGPSGAESANSLDSGAAHGAQMKNTQHQDPVAMPEGNSFGADSLLYVLVRWALFTGLLLTIGAVAFRQLVLRFLRRKEDPDSPMLSDAEQRAARIGHWAAGSLIVALVLRLFAQSVAMHGTAGMFDVGLVSAMLAKTLWGRGWLLQLVGIVISGYGFHRAKNAAPRSAPSRQGWSIATIGIVILAFTAGLAGHAAAAPKLAALTLFADGLHVIGGGGWLGSLAIVLLAGIPAAMALPEPERGPMVAELVNAFSPTALMFAGLVTATGVFAAWMHLGALPALWQTNYGRTLLIKLALLSVMAFTGAYNWLRVKPALGQVEGAVLIRRSATVEVIVGIIVLLITAVLVATPTAMDMKM